MAVTGGGRWCMLPLPCGDFAPLDYPALLLPHNSLTLLNFGVASAVVECTLAKEKACEYGLRASAATDADQ